MSTQFNKNYIVRVTIVCGEYEKSNHVLVNAPTENDACHYAILIESHNPDRLDWSGNYVNEPCHTFAYAANVIKEIASYHLSVIRHNFDIYNFDLSELEESGNYLKFMNS